MKKDENPTLQNSLICLLINVSSNKNLISDFHMPNRLEMTQKPNCPGEIFSYLK
nr:MAG TPA: hypothetical protein [Caudoviricetes sp.]